MLQWIRYGLHILRSKTLALIFAAIAVPVGAQDTEVLALGDSLTQGYGLLDTDGFVPQLNSWLQKNGRDVRIVNGGVSGDTSAGGLARADWSIGPMTDAMIVALGGNDLLRGIPPEVTRANIEGILQVAQERGLPVLLIGMTAPANYGADYKLAFDGLYPELAQEFDALYLHSFFAGLMQDANPIANFGRFMQPDGIHPNAQGVARIVDVIGPRVIALLDRVESSQPAKN